MNSIINNVIGKRMCKKLIKELEGRLKLLEEYRNKDIDKEILDTLNEITKYKLLLKKLNKESY